MNESTKVCAERELREETGYDSDELVQLLSLKATVAYDDELIDVYLARNIRKIGAQQLDPAESINMKAFTLDEVLQAIKDLKIQDAKTVAGIMAYRSWLAMQEQKSVSGFEMPETLLQKMQRLIKRAHTG